jgi:hypothetical protein
MARTLAMFAVLLLIYGCAAPNQGDRLLSRDGEVRVPQATVFPMSLDDVRRMTRDGKTPSDIIAELDRTSTVIDLRPSQVTALLEAGIHPDVLDWLHQRQLDALGDGWKTRVAQQQQEHVKDLQRLRNEMELRAFSRYPFGYPYPFYRYGPGFHFGF